MWSPMKAVTIDGELHVTVPFDETTGELAVVRLSNRFDGPGLYVWRTDGGFRFRRAVDLHGGAVRFADKRDPVLPTSQFEKTVDGKVLFICRRPQS